MIGFLKVVLLGYSKHVSIGFNIHTFYLGDRFVKRHNRLPNSKCRNCFTPTVIQMLYTMHAPTLRNKEKTVYWAYVT